MFQALLFYMPRIFWRTMSIKAGLNICDLVDAARNYKSASNYKNRLSFMSYLIKNIDQYVDDDRRYENNRSKNRLLRIVNKCVPCCGRFLGDYIVILYFVTKIIYILNTCAQIMIVGALLGKSFWYFGIVSIKHIISDNAIFITETKYFPSKSIYAITDIKCIQP